MEKDFVRDFKVSLELAGEKRVSCDNLFDLMENISKHGSISRAAAEMGISYRYAWGIVGITEKALGIHLVHRQVGGSEGGGTSLSIEGKELLEQYKSFRQEVELRLEHFSNRAAICKDSSFADDTADAASAGQQLLLASTMEPVETGLLDVLEEAFFQSTGILVRHVALGSGRALELAKKGRVDMALTHAPALEEKFMLQGWGASIIPVMSNDFVLAGPIIDTAGLSSLDHTNGIKEAFRCIAAAAAPFVSRGDRSGTHLKELQIWDEAGVTPGGDWYSISSGIAGNMGVLRLAQGKRAYALVDRATFVLSRSAGSIKIYRGNEEGTALPGELDNVFSLVLVNPQRVQTVNFQGALLFARWIREAQAMRIIEGFGRESFERPLFVNVSDH